MVLTEEQVIAQADPLFENDIEEALINIYSNGFHDAEAGSVTENGLHVFRVANWTLETDSQGFTYVEEHKSALKAHQYMEKRTGYFIGYREELD